MVCGSEKVEGEKEKVVNSIPPESQTMQTSGRPRLAVDGVWEWLQNGNAAESNAKWKAIEGNALVQIVSAETAQRVRTQATIGGKTFFYDLTALTQQQMGKEMKRPIRFRLHGSGAVTFKGPASADDAPWKRQTNKMLETVAARLALARKSVLLAETEEENARAVSEMWMSFEDVAEGVLLLSRKKRRFEVRQASKTATHLATAKRTGVPTQPKHGNTRIGDAYGAASNAAAAAGMKAKSHCKFWKTGLKNGCTSGSGCKHLHDEEHAARGRLKNEAAARSAAQKAEAKEQKQNSEMSGTVKTWREEKGFGFISAHDQRLVRDDLFVHVSDLVRGNCLFPGKKVFFDLGMSEKGQNAVLVNGDGVGNRTPPTNNRKRKQNTNSAEAPKRRRGGDGRGRRR